jgi:hypothetical protein
MKINEILNNNLYEMWKEAFHRKKLKHKIVKQVRTPPNQYIKRVGFETLKPEKRYF